MNRWRRYWTLLRDVRQWARRSKQNTLDVIARAVERFLEYEAQPHCERCDSVDLRYGFGDFATGVTAPDGGSESRYSEYMECGRCGYRN